MIELRDSEAPSPAADDVRNGLEIQFFGLQRSGNHAVLAWVFQQFDEPVYFFNMVKPFTDPILNWRYAYLPNSVNLPRGPARNTERAEKIRNSRLEKLEAIRRHKKRVLVHSYENLRLEDLERRPLIADREAWIGDSGSVCRVLLLRDFYNWMASRIRLIELKKASLPRELTGLVSLWLGYAKEYVRETQFLGSTSIVTISYNRWFSDDAYRMNLLPMMGVPVRDPAVRYVPETGGGSSFDGMTFADRPTAMRVEERWKFLLQDRLQHLIGPVRDRRADIEHYNRKIFGLETPFP